MKFTLSQVSRGALAGLALAGSLAFAVPAAAQADDARLRKIESEIRALQRKVFPNGDGRFFTPEVITPSGQQPPPNTVGTPSETAVTDILARLDALEAQLARLTARSEENSNKIAQLESKVAGLAAPAPAPAPADAGEPRQPTGVLVAAQPASSASGTAAPAPKPTPTPAATAPSPARLAAVKAIEKPATGDPGRGRVRLWVPPVGRRLLSRGGTATEAVRREVSRITRRSASAATCSAGPISTTASRAPRQPTSSRITPRIRPARAGPTACCTSPKQ